MSQKPTPSNGRSTVLENSQSAEKQTGNTYGMEDDKKYRCPFCDTEYDNEILTRVHVTRSKDETHKNQNGFMPEVAIEVVDEDGNVVDTIERRPKDMDSTTVTLNDLPDYISEEHKHILLEATHNPQDDYTTLTDSANKRLSDNNLEKFSYSTIRRVVRDFYCPQEGESQDTESRSEEQLQDLTIIQQGIVIAKVIHPDESHSHLADRVGCAASYPSRVCERADHIIDQLQEKIDQGEPAEVIQEELGDEDIVEMRKQGLLERVDISFDREINTDTGNSSEKWGSPITQSKGLSASPEISRDSDSTDVTQSPATTSTSTKKADDTTEGESENKTEAEKQTSIGQTGDDEEILNEVEQLKSNVGFMQNYFEEIPQSQLDAEDIKLAVFARRVEQSCDRILCQNIQNN